MNIADKMKRESRLRGNLAEWMMAHGTVKSDRERSNEYVGVRIAEVCWRGRITASLGWTGKPAGLKKSDPVVNYTISPTDICAVYVPNPLAIICRKSEYVYYRKGKHRKRRKTEC